MPNLLHKYTSITDLVYNQEIKLSISKIESKKDKFQFTCRRVSFYLILHLLLDLGITWWWWWWTGLLMSQRPLSNSQILWNLSRLSSMGLSSEHGNNITVSICNIQNHQISNLAKGRYQALCYTVRTYVCTNPLLCICSKPDAILQHICNVTPCWFRASAVAMFCDRKLFKSPCNKGMVLSSLFAVMHIYLSFNNHHV